VRLIDSFVYGGPGETPWGEISGCFEDGTLGSGTPIPFDYYRIFGRIDASPLSYDIERDMDYDGEVESYAGSEVGLFYAQAYADVIQSGVVDREWGSAQAAGTACFTVDNGPLSLHWNYERSPYGDSVFPNSFQLRVHDWETLGYICNYDIGSPFEGTVTLDLTPGKLYVLYWDVQVGAGWGFDHSGSARLTLDLADLGDTTSPISAVVDVTADTITPRTRSITCNIRPPDGYSVTDIVVESIRLQGTVSPTSTSVRKGQMLVVKFPTTGLNLQPGDLVLTVTGQLTDGASFQGSDTVTVVEKKGGHK
jgi:hypothetical protein